MPSGVSEPAAVARSTRSLPGLLLVLGLSSAALDLGAVYAKRPVIPPGLTLGDLLDLTGTYAFAALVLWIALAISGSARRSGRAAPRAEAGGWAVLAAAALTFTLGRGVHLSANSIHDLVDRVGAAEVAPIAYLWDERIGHYLADAGRSAVAAALALLEFVRAPAATPPAGRIPLAVGAGAYGFISFANAVEGQTVALALPYAVLYVAADLLARRGSPGRPAPVRGFFAIASGIALLFYGAWGVWQGGLPEFSRVGLIP